MSSRQTGARAPTSRRCERRSRLRRRPSRWFTTRRRPASRTPSSLFYAFHRALLLLKEEGLEARIARHAKVAARLRDGLGQLGFSPLGSANLLSNTVTCFAPPASVDANRLVRRLRDEHNIYISGGLRPVRGKTIPIGTMGTQADPEIIDWLLKAIRASL